MENIDTHLHSRQTSTYNIDTNEKIPSLNIFIYGMRGLGVEIAKNLICAGPKRVTLYDDNLVINSDLGTNCFLSESDVSKNSRADASLIKLQQLNANVNVSVYKGELAHNFNILKGYDVVVISELIARGTAESLNNFCRDRKIAFIYCASLGLSGFSFTDFGEDFVTKDPDGEECKQYCIKSISRANPGIVTIAESCVNTKLYLSHGDYVTFKEVVGMTELNESPPRPVKVISSVAFTIEDTSKFSEHSSGGIVEQVKIPKPMFFKPLKECFENIHKEEFEFFPDTISQMDVSKPLRNEMLHLSFLAIHEFFNQQSRLPYLNNKEDAEKVVEISKVWLEAAKEKKRMWALNLTDIDEIVIKTVAKFCRAQIPAVFTFLGGLVAQEILKVTHKYMPFNQWFWFDFFESLGKTPNSDTNVEKKNLNQDQTAVFGKNLYAKLTKMNILIVGSDQLNDELSRLLSLMGVSSNVNKISTYNEDDEFWLHQDVIFIITRDPELKNQVTQKCTWLHKAYIDINTFGNKAYTQVIVPDLTSSWCDADEFLTCLSTSSVTNSPSLNEYCKEWARNMFNEYFKQTIKELNELLFLADKAEEEDVEEETLIVGVLDNLVKGLSHEKSKEKLQILKKLIEVILSNSFEKCVEFAVNKFEEIFEYKMKQQLFRYPVDCENDESSKLFSDFKRCPNPIPLNLNDSLHLFFISSFAFLISNALNISADSFHNIKSIAEKHNFSCCHIFSLCNKCNQKFGRTSSNNSGNNKSNDLEIEKEIKLIKESIVYLIEKTKKVSKLNVNELDDDSYCLEFIRLATDLRTQNFIIKDTDYVRTQLIVDKSNPLILTTTSVITGLAALQLYSFARNSKDVSNFRNSFVNLGSSLIVSTQPFDKKINRNFVIANNEIFKTVPEEWSIWDKIEVEGPLTVNQFSQFFEKNYQVKITNINFLHDTKLNLDLENLMRSDKLEDKLEDLYFSNFDSNKTYSNRYFALDVSAKTEASEKALLPSIKYSF